MHSICSTNLNYNHAERRVNPYSIGNAKCHNHGGSSGSQSGIFEVTLNGNNSWSLHHCHGGRRRPYGSGAGWQSAGDGVPGSWRIAGDLDRLLQACTYCC